MRSSRCPSGLAAPPGDPWCRTIYVNDRGRDGPQCRPSPPPPEGRGTRPCSLYSEMVFIEERLKKILCSEHIIVPRTLSTRSNRYKRRNQYPTPLDFWKNFSIYHATSHRFLTVSLTAANYRARLHQPGEAPFGTFYVCGRASSMFLRRTT